MSQPIVKENPSPLARQECIICFEKLALQQLQVDCEDDMEKCVIRFAWKGYVSTVVHVNITYTVHQIGFFARNRPVKLHRRLRDHHMWLARTRIQRTVAADAQRCYFRLVLLISRAIRTADHVWASNSSHHSYHASAVRR